MTDQERKIKELKEAVKNLRMCQDELRMARAKYNQLVNELVDGGS
jgi:hypothetical protein